MSIDMSNDLYDDLTDEEKALLKREVKHRIEQQRARENIQARMPLILIVTGIFTTIMCVFAALPTPSNRYVLNPGANERLLLIAVLPGATIALFGVGLWLWRRYKGTEDNSPKNKRG